MVEYAIAFALRGASNVVRGFKQGLTETSATRSPITSSASSQSAATLGIWAMKPSAAMRRRPDRAAECRAKNNDYGQTLYCYGASGCYRQQHVKYAKHATLCLRENVRYLL